MNCCRLSRLLRGGVLLLVLTFGTHGWSAPASAPGLAGVTALDGKAIDPFGLESSVKANVFVFVAVDCPVSNKYAPELCRLAGEFESHGARFWLVYPAPDTAVETIRKHVAEFGFPGRPIYDREQRLARKSRVAVTPEAAVFSPDGELVYHGRIDNRFPQLGIDRTVASEITLELVLKAYLSGEKPPVKETKAVGCRIPAIP